MPYGCRPWDLIAKEKVKSEYSLHIILYLFCMLLIPFPFLRSMQPRWFGRRNIWRKSPQRILLSLPPITICTLSSYHLPTTPRFSQNCNALCPATPTEYLKFRLSRLDPSRQARPPPNFNVVTVFPFVIQQPRRKKTSLKFNVDGQYEDYAKIHSSRQAYSPTLKFGGRRTECCWCTRFVPWHSE